MIKLKDIRHSFLSNAMQSVNIYSFLISASDLQYTPVISPSEKTLPARLNMEIIKRLQEDVAPEIFTPPAVYDGRKNMFAPRLLPFEDGKPNQDVCNIVSSSYSFLNSRV